MNTKKIAGIVIIIVLATIGVAAVLWNSPEMKRQREQERITAERMAQVKEHNPELYENLTKAVKEGEELSKSEPNNFDAWAELATNYQNLGDYEKAEKAYKRALEISVNSMLVWNNLAKLYESTGRNEEAIAAYQKIIELFPSDPAAYNDLATLYERLGRQQDAIYIRGQYKLRNSVQPSGGEVLQTP